VLLDRDRATRYNGEGDTDINKAVAKASAPLVNGMALELRAPYKDIQSNIRPMLTYIVLAFACVLVLAIGYTILVTHRIVAPLKKLTAAAAEISSGDQEVNLLVDSKDEIGILSRVLSDAYAKIRGYSAYINALAYMDSLTGMSNNTAYTQATAEIDADIRRGKAGFGVMVVDINNLKKTNDTYGHDAGNALIIQTARIISEIFKGSIVYRIGGDEFVVILQRKDMERHRELMEKMDRVISGYRVAVEGGSVPISFARGIAVYDSAVDHKYKDVFARADQEMYLNKAAMKAAIV